MPELQNLPPEVLFSVAEFLNHDDRKNLSAVNASFRSTFAPSLFKTLKVDCPVAKNLGSLLKDTIRKFGAHVVELRFNVTFYPRQKDTENNDENTDWFWADPPASVWARDMADVDIMHELLHFKGLPQCKSLTVYTNGHENFSENDMGGEESEWDDNDMGGTGMYFCSDPEEWEDVISMEHEYLWRTYLRDMYRDIATLSPTQDLKFLNFLPRKVSFWQEPEWSAFLGRLKKLTLHTYGGQNDAFEEVATLEGFEAFFNDLSSVLFTHATELEYLGIVALGTGYLGAGSLLLDPLTMPKLQKLHLQNVAANAILIPFLRGRKLKKLVMDDCTATVGDKDLTPQPTWKDLFARIRQSITTPAEIKIMFSRKAPLTRDEADRRDEEGYVHLETEDAHIKRLRAMAHSNVCIWPYVDFDTKYGFVFPDPDMNASRLGLGDDILEFLILEGEVHKGGGSISVEIRS